MKKFFKNILSTIIGIISSLIVLSIILIGFFAFLSPDKQVKVKENSILKIDLSSTAVVERRATNPFDALNMSGDLTQSLEIKEILDNIEKAKNDINIKAIYLNNQNINAGLSQTEEIRNEITRISKTTWQSQYIAYAKRYIHKLRIT